MPISFVQLGKQGITDNFSETLKSHFKTHQIVKVNVLKNARPEGKEGREKMKEYEKKLLDNLGANFTARTIGFTIILRKWRKAQR